MTEPVSTWATRWRAMDAAAKGGPEGTGLGCGGMLISLVIALAAFLWLVESGRSYMEKVSDPEYRVHRARLSPADKKYYEEWAVERGLEILGVDKYGRPVPGGARR